VADKTFHCSVLTPERSVLESEVTSAALHASDGEIGVLHDRAPLLCRLGVGVMRLETPDGPRKVFLDAGFAEVNDNRLTVLTEQAAFPEDVDVAAEEAGLSAARDQHATTEAEQDQRRRAIERAKAKLKLVKS